MAEIMTEVVGADVQSVLNRLRFNVRKEPLFTRAGLETSHDAIVRSEPEQVLSVVSRKYALVPHYDAVAPLVEEADKLGFILATRSGGRSMNPLRIEGNGRRVYIEMWNPSVSSTIQADVHHPRLVMYNSLDATTRAGIIAGGYVVRCTNGMVSVRDMLGFKGRRHLGDALNDMRRMEELALRFMENYEEVSQAWSRLSEIQPGEERAVKAIEAVSIRKADDIIEMVESVTLNDATGWDIFQSGTNYLTHTFKGSTQMAIAKQRKMLSILNGED